MNREGQSADARGRRKGSPRGAEPCPKQEVPNAAEANEQTGQKSAARRLFHLRLLGSRRRLLWNDQSSGCRFGSGGSRGRLASDGHLRRAAFAGRFQHFLNRGRAPAGFAAAAAGAAFAAAGFSPAAGAVAAPPGFISARAAARTSFVDFGAPPVPAGAAVGTAFAGDATVADGAAPLVPCAGCRQNVLR